MFDLLIVGSGFFGATFARLATDAGKTCLVIDKNNHIAGTAFDRVWDNGIIVSEYGAHIFHCNSDKIWQFINQFCEIESFINKPKVLSQGKVYSFPINMMTLHQLWGVVTPKEALKKLNEVRIPCENPRNFEEWALDKIGHELYEKFIYGYSKKHWMKEPRELPASIIRRLPIRLTYDENYFTTKYQGIPKEGYTQCVKNMLDGIKVELNTDFFSLDWKKYAKHLVFTGPIDKFFNYEFGELEYKTMKFVHERCAGDYQGNAVFNHVDIDVPYLRTVEHKHFKRNNQKFYGLDETETVVSYDYPISYKDNPEPYYPVRDDTNSALYEKYRKLLPSNVSIGGRLGSYTYCDIDQTIANAMTMFERLT